MAKKAANVLCGHNHRIDASGSKMIGNAVTAVA
jgi:hypothetical protein